MPILGFLADPIKGEHVAPSVSKPFTALSKEGLVELVTRNKTPRDLMIQLNGGSPIVTPEPDRIYREDDQIEFQAEWNKDIETDKLVDGRQIIWTYYPTGEVDKIVILTLDKNAEVVKQKTIKHFTDERQPEVTYD